MNSDTIALGVQATAITFIVALAAVVVYCRQLRRAGARTDFGSDHAVPSVGLLHPNAGGGGGGERVLWVAIETLMAADRRSGIKRVYTLYTKRYPAPAGFESGASQADPLKRPGVGRTSAEDTRDTAHLLSLVRQQFNLTNVDPERLHVVYLTRTWMLDPKYYPRLTLLLQSFVGALGIFWDVASRGATDIIVDTVGIPCCYWLFNIVCGSAVAAYVHYPVISTDMVQKVASRRADFNNAGTVARSGLLTQLKVAYYRMFAVLYRWTGGNFASVVMTNSSWTNDHVQFMWQRRDTTIVYPPCGVPRFIDACKDLDASQRDDTIVSVGQFRPEKDHSLQLRAFARALKGGAIPKNTKLHLVGGCRDDGDRQRVEELKALAAKLEITASVCFEVSVPAARVVDLLTRATVGLHTMRDEHFGIVVAEYMAAGAIAVANNSAGPKRDIVREGEGFLASTEEEYVAALRSAFKLKREDPAGWNTMATAARKSSTRFTDRFFASRFVRCLAPVLALTLLPEEDDDGVKLCC